MDQYVKAEIQLYCQAIKTGKPSALIPIQNKHVTEAKEIIEEECLEAYITKLSNGWNSLWIYKEDYLLEIIKEMPEQPRTVYDHWVLGKIFGYSDESIRKFVTNGIPYDCN